MAMFLIDRIPRKNPGDNSTINKAIQEINVREDVRKERYLYYTEKVAISLLVLLLSILFGMGTLWTEQKEAKERVLEITREELLEQTYDLVVEKNEKETETVQLILGERIRTEKELIKILEQKRETLEKVFLGENESPERIVKNVNLISVLEEDQILVTWEISNPNLVSYEGKLQDGINPKGEEVLFTAVMTLEQVSLKVEIPTKVFPLQQSGSLQEQLQAYLDETDESKEKISLPESFQGNQLQFYEQTDSFGVWILPVGIVLAVVLFFYKDQDLKKKVQERNRQMEADYSELVGQLLLYYRAGLSLRSVIEKIVMEYKEEKKGEKGYFRYAYEELEVAHTKMNSGISQVQAIVEFGERCGLQNYMKLAGIIEQNQRRGTKELVSALMAEQRSALVERKNRALRTGSEITTKLLGPMILLLIITMAIVVIPSFLSMNLN
jgi:hypothetical protein